MSGDVGAEVAAVLATERCKDAHPDRWLSLAGLVDCAPPVARVCRTCESWGRHVAAALAPLIAERVEAAKAEEVALRERVEDALALAEQRQHPMDPRAATIYVAEVRAALAPEAR